MTRMEHPIGADVVFQTEVCSIVMSLLLHLLHEHQYGSCPCVLAVIASRLPRDKLVIGFARAELVNVSALLS